MFLRNKMLVMVCVAVGAMAHAESTEKSGSMIQDIVGDKAPYFWGYIAEDVVHSFRAVKYELYDCGEKLIFGGKFVSQWALEQLRNNGKSAVRVGYQVTKIGVGGVACMFPLPNWMCGLNSRGRVNRYDEWGNVIDSQEAPGYIKLWQNVPTRVVGIGLILHGLRGLARQAGFNCVGEIYNFVEDNASSGEVSKPVEKKPTSSAKKPATTARS